ncbi:hypothetical protein ACFPPD_05670 [Cohnella suwonensis]|uniref:DUF3298 domain-containing protein n=1 Tax=Cohnella suwonensis TaxID=696072 RepID=A0ABW0LQM5_9BACL
MNKEDYKRAFGKIEPDAHYEQRLARNLSEYGRSKASGLKRRAMVSAAVGLAVVACAGIITFSGLDGGSNPIATQPPGQTVADGSVFIPKLELPEKTNAMMQMIGLIVYQGRIYTQTSTRIPPEAAEAVLGEKIGRTKANIDEWSSQSEYAEELASTVGELDVYTVQGYDSDFRIMTYQIFDGRIVTEYYECLNGIRISSGVDLLGKLNIVGNVQSASWETYDSWNNSQNQRHELAVDATLDNFLKALSTAKPIAAEKLFKQGIYDQGGQSRKFVLLKLKDQSEVRLELHEDGYVRYVPADVFFKLEDAAFDAMWTRLNAFRK